MPIPALLAAVPSVFQGIMGIGQMNRARRELDALQRPVYDIPDATKSQLALASAAYADPRMPGESTAYSRIGQTLSTFIRGARNQSNPLAGLAMAQANTNSAYNDLATQSAAHQEGDRRVLMDNLANYSKYEDQKFQYNKHAPWADAYNEAREQWGAGRQNVFGALNGIASVGMNYLSGQKAAVDGATVRDAGLVAQEGSAQDRFIESAANFAKGNISSAMKTYAPGLTPAQMMSFINSNYSKLAP